MTGESLTSCVNQMASCRWLAANSHPSSQSAAELGTRPTTTRPPTHPPGHALHRDVLLQGEGGELRDPPTQILGKPRIQNCPTPKVGGGGGQRPSGVYVWYFLRNVYPYLPFPPSLIATFSLLGLFPSQTVHLLPIPNMYVPCIHMESSPLWGSPRRQGDRETARVMELLLISPQFEDPRDSRGYPAMPPCFWTQRFQGLCSHFSPLWGP